MAAKHLLVLALCTSTGCISGGINRAYYKDGKWTVPGPAEVQTYLICMEPSATGSQQWAQQVADTLAPTVYRAIGRPSEDAKTVAMESHLCQELGALRTGEFEITPPLHMLLGAMFEKIPNNSLVVPVSFINYDRNTTEIRARDGQVIATMDGRGVHASGQVSTRLFVFTREGKLAYNGYAPFVSIDAYDRSELRHQADKLTEKLTEHFTEDVLPKN
jgi:hypothetical protein